MKLHVLFALSCCLATLSPLAANAQDTFTFENQTIGNFLTATPGGTVNTVTSDTNPARTFTAASPTPDLAFEFLGNGVSYGTNLSGTVLESASADPTLDTLTLNFDQAITSFSTQFAILDFGEVYALTLTGGGETDTEAGAVDPTSFNYQGGLSISSATPFSSVSFTLTSSGLPTAYALDNFIVTPAAVPEPGTVAFALALGLPAAWQIRRKLARK